MKRPQKIDIRFKSLKNILEEFFSYYFLEIYSIYFFSYFVYKKERFIFQSLSYK